MEPRGPKTQNGRERKVKSNYIQLKDDVEGPKKGARKRKRKRKEKENVEKSESSFKFVPLPERRGMRIEFILLVEHHFLLLIPSFSVGMLLTLGEGSESGVLRRRVGFFFLDSEEQFLSAV